MQLDITRPLGFQTFVKVTRYAIYSILCLAIKFLQTYTLIRKVGPFFLFVKKIMCYLTLIEVIVFFFYLKAKQQSNLILIRAQEKKLYIFTESQDLETLSRYHNSCLLGCLVVSPL